MLNLLYHRFLWTGIALIVVLQLPHMVTYLTHAYRKSVIKKEVKLKILNGLNDNEISHLTFHKDDIKKLLRWEHDREFEYKKMMYDIVKTEKKGDSITYHCWADVEESILYAEIKASVKTLCHSDPIEKKTQQLHIDFLKNLFYQALFSYHSYEKVARPKENVLITTTVNHYINPFLFQKGPPPEI